MTHFRWLGRETVTRSKDGSGGVPLAPGHIYKTADFAPAVVGEWIATGNAESVKVQANDTALDVKSVTVKPKAPRIGAEL